MELQWKPIPSAPGMEAAEVSMGGFKTGALVRQNGSLDRREAPALVWMPGISLTALGVKRTDDPVKVVEGTEVAEPLSLIGKDPIPDLGMLTDLQGLRELFDHRGIEYIANEFPEKGTDQRNLTGHGELVKTALSFKPQTHGVGGTGRCYLLFDDSDNLIGFQIP